MLRLNRNMSSVAEAIVHRVDAVNRELVVIVADMLVNIYVPSNCDIVLRGERIKLRMVQPGDRVRVTCTGRVGYSIARHVEVQPNWPPALAP